MSEQNGKQAKVVQRPADDDEEAWEKYWEAQGQPWRTEPEIDAERQAYLSKRRTIRLDIEQDNYSFKAIKLDRADIEWLLATHDNGRGPVYPSDEGQRYRRRGLFLMGADLRGANMADLPLGNTSFVSSHLKRANLAGAHLENASFIGAHLEDAILIFAHLEGARLDLVHLEGANLSNAYFDSTTSLDNAVFANERLGAARLADVHWHDVNLAVVDWSTLSIVGDETFIKSGEKWSRASLPRFYQSAARAYRQLAVVLRNQGLSEDANRFAYRAQLMQRKVFWYQGKIFRYLGSLSLDLLAGHGYRWWRTFRAYLIVTTTFALTYFIIGQKVGPALSPLGAWVFSMTSFHGRGFFPGGIKMDDPLTVLAAFEAFIGLLIEVTFIATLTRRLFGQ